MHPAGASAGGAMVNARAVARGNIILGLLAMATMALVAAAMLNPGDLVLEGLFLLLWMATMSEAQGLRETALELLLIAVVQAVLAAAGSLNMLGQWLAAPAYIIGAMSASSVCYVVSWALADAIVHCPGDRRQYHAGSLIIGCVFLAVSYAALLGVRVADAFCF